MESNTNRSTTIALTVVLLLSVLLNIYLWMTHNSTIVKYDTNIDSLVQVRVSLEKELQLTSSELGKYKGISRNLDSLVNEANFRIEEREQKIKELLRNQQNSSSLNRKLQAELQSIQKMRDMYFDRIDSLLTENQQLKDENMQLSTSVSSLTAEKGALEEKVFTASQLRAEYLKVNTEKKKSSGKFVPASLARKTDRFNVCFSLLDNKVTPAGEKTIYLRIIAPDGLPIGSRSKGSRSFVKPDTKEEVFFTKSQTVNYANERQDLCMDYENDERNLVPGSYKVEIYVDGFLTTTSVIDLK